MVAAPLVDWVVTQTERGWKAGWELVMLASAISCLLTVLFVREKAIRDSEDTPGHLSSASDDRGDGSTSTRAAKVYRTTKDWKTADAFRSPTLWLFAIGSLGFVVPFMVCIAHSALHLRDLGIAPSAASLALGMFTAFSIAGRLVAGFLGDRIEPRLLWAVFLFLLAGGCLAITQARTIPVVILYALLVGLGFGGAFICRTITIGNYFGVGAFASIDGILGTMLTIFGATTPWLGGLIRDTQGSYALAFVGIAILSSLGGLCLLMVKEPKESRAAGSSQYTWA